MQNIHVQIILHISTNIHVQIILHIYTNILVQIIIHIYTKEQKHINIDTHLPKHKDTDMYPCTQTKTYICIHIHMNKWASTYVYLRILVVKQFLCYLVNLIIQP